MIHSDPAAATAHSNRSSRSGRWARRFALALGLVTGMAHAALIKVEHSEVEFLINGQCSLLEAIHNAETDSATHPDCEAGDGADIVQLAENSEYVLTQPVADGASIGLPLIGSTLTIDGQGSIIRRDNRADTPAFRLMQASSAELTLKNLTLQDGRHETVLHFEGGGALWLRGGTLVAEQVRFIDNAVTPNGRGSAVYISSGSSASRTQVTLRDCLFTGNHVDSVSGQHTTGGGAINIEYGDLTIERCAFIGNRTKASEDPEPGGFGGAIYITDLASTIDGEPFGTTATIRDTTFSGNRAGTGGAINLQSVQGFFLLLNLRQSTVVDNHAFSPARGIAANATHDGGQIFINYFASILHANGSNPADWDCVTTGGLPRVYWESMGGNFLSPDGGCSADLFNHDFVDADTWAHLQPTLLDHGHDLKAGSYLIDAFSGSACDHGNSLDQRGRIRGGGPGFGGPHCDIGAVEYYGLPNQLFSDRFEVALP